MFTRVPGNPPFGTEASSAGDYQEVWCQICEKEKIEFCIAVVGIEAIPNGINVNLTSKLAASPERVDGTRVGPLWCRCRHPSTAPAGRAVKRLLARGGLVLGDQVGGHATAVLDVVAVLVTPVPDLGRVDAAAALGLAGLGGVTAVTGDAGVRPVGLEEFVPVCVAELSLERFAGLRVEVLPRPDALVAGTVEVVDEQSDDLLRHRNQYYFL